LLLSDLSADLQPISLLIDTGSS